MNALAAHEFGEAKAATAEWLVLRCAPARTMALATALAAHGAWTPTWKRRRRLPRSPISRVVTEACIPGMVFVPAAEQYALPNIPRCPARFMQNADWTLVRVPDRQMEPLRKIADKPLMKARDLPKPGSRVKFNAGPFQGLTASVITCTQRHCSVAVDGFKQVDQVPPTLLERTL